MNDDRRDDDNPYAVPSSDLPAEIQPDAGLGRVAGWIFLILGLYGLAQMAYRISHGNLRADLGAVAMLFIGRGLLKGSDTARRWGIGCAGTYLGLLLIGGGLLLWLWRGRTVELEFFSITGGATTIVVMAVGIAVFSLLLWLLLHPRTRAAYRARTRRTARPRPRRPARTDHPHPDDHAP